MEKVADIVAWLATTAAAVATMNTGQYMLTVIGEKVISAWKFHEKTH